MVNYPRRKLPGCNHLGAIFLGGTSPGCNCTGGNYLRRGGNCPRWELSREDCPGGNCPRWQLSGGEVIVQRGIVLFPYIDRQIDK